MGKQTLILEDDWDREEVLLFAFHTASELYKLGYWINVVLETQLQYRRKPLYVWRKEKKLSFPLYDYEDDFHDRKFYLIGNTIEYQMEEYRPDELFFDNNSNQFESFIPERREVDAFLKIEGSEEVGDWLPALRKIKALSAVYAVDIKTVRSYTNFIFE